MSPIYPTSFDAENFRWAEPKTDGSRVLEYVGFGTVIRIAMYRLVEGGYSLGPMSDPQFEGNAEEAFTKCGGLPALGRAAHWFANSS